MGGARSTGNLRAREGRRVGVRRTGRRMSLSHQDAVQGRGIGAEGMVRREVGGDARSASGASGAGAMPEVRPGRAGPGRCQKCVRGERGQTWMCGVGPGRAVLHIRAGPAGGGLAESCGNALVLNAVEILPCAERAALHMGARPLKTDILEEPRNHAENSEPARAGVTLQCATPPHGPGRTPRGRPRSRQMKQYPRNRPGKNPTRPAAALRQNPAGSPSPAGDRPQPSTPGRPADLPHPA